MASHSYRLLIVLAVLVGLGLTPRVSEAQRLLQRIQNRVESIRASTAEREDSQQQDEQSGQPEDEDAEQSPTPAQRLLQSLLPVDGAGDSEPNLAAPRTPAPGLGRNGDQAGDSGQLGEYGQSILARPQTPSLGIQVLPTQSGPPGLVVAAIDSHSLADEAGLRVGDTLVAMDGLPTYSPAIVAQQLQKRSVGERSQIRIIRDGKPQEIQIPLVGPPASLGPPTSVGPRTLQPIGPAVPLGESSSGSVAGGSGWTAEGLGAELSESSNRRGLVVSNVQPNSPAAAGGIREGDRLVSIDGRLITSRDSLARHLSRVDAESTLLLKLVRGQSLVEAELSREINSSVDTSTTPTVADNKPPATGLGGLGSVIGGFFGGAPATQASGQQAIESSDRDTMALDDEETVEQAIFESDTNTVNKEPVPALDNDPPSLVPLGEEFDKQKQLEELKRREQQIRLELEKLRLQIEQLEKK